MFDAYTRKARLAPAILASVPAIGVLVAGAVVPSASSSLIALVVGAVGIVVCSAVRDRGRALESLLWESWGGPPTRRRLRWRDSDDPEALARLHKRLAATVGSPLPTRTEEEADPAAADRRYDEVIAELRERTREGFPLVLAENSEYGFRRNALGLQPVALGVAALCFVVSVVLAVGVGDRRFVLAAVVALVDGLLWRRISPSWVCRAAEVYADRLLEASRGV
jgi:hypothetical protein